jgi:hypothetical protein
MNKVENDILNIFLLFPEKKTSIDRLLNLDYSISEILIALAHLIDDNILAYHNGYICVKDDFLLLKKVLNLRYRLSAIFLSTIIQLHKSYIKYNVDFKVNTKIVWQYVISMHYHYSPSTRRAVMYELKAKKIIVDGILNMQLIRPILVYLQVNYEHSNV